MSDSIQHRYDFSLFFDVENGNPNGDPGAGNMPRIDPETSLGIVSDVCLKRKVRNYVDLVKSESVEDVDASGDLGYKIYVQEKAVLNMCNNFYDIRAFGAVMATEVNCGQVRGPIQMCFGQSIDPVVPQEMSITRMAVTNQKDVDKERTMGRKQYVPYGLYRVNGFISASLAEKTGFSQADLDLFFEALMNMFENDRSAARGLMTSRKLYVFEHESKLGNAPAHTLFDTVTARKDSDGPARAYGDYEIVADKSAVPEGVTLHEYDWIAPSA